jgi:hypothetical protein
MHFSLCRQLYKQCAPVCCVCVCICIITQQIKTDISLINYYTLPLIPSCSMHWFLITLIYETCSETSQIHIKTITLHVCFSVFKYKCTCNGFLFTKQRTFFLGWSASFYSTWYATRFYIIIDQSTIAINTVSCFSSVSYVKCNNHRAIKKTLSYVKHVSSHEKQKFRITC